MPEIRGRTRRQFRDIFAPKMVTRLSPILEDGFGHRLAILSFVRRARNVVFLASGGGISPWYAAEMAATADDLFSKGSHFIIDDSFVHRIRVDFGKTFHHKRTDPKGKVDTESIASENGVSESQVREQMEYLRSQNMICGPLANEGLQVRGVPDNQKDDHHLTEDGLNWAMAGYPVI